MFAAILLLRFSTIPAEYGNHVKVHPLLKTDTTCTGQQLRYPDTSSDEVSIIKVTIPPGTETGRHLHGFSVFAYVLKGTLTVETDDRKKFTYPEGSTISETVGTIHNGKNVGHRCRTDRDIYG